MPQPGRKGLLGLLRWAPLLALGSTLAIPIAAQEMGTGEAARTTATTDRYPGDAWMQYADVSEAGFSPEDLARARRFWEHRGAASFLAVSRGAVVASWGDVDRRFLSHSMRKSFLSVLYGVYSDEIDLDLTLAELDIDDVSALTEQEKQARVADLIQSRSGVYHPAAAEPAEMSGGRPDRGSHPPGSYWWYNNWDFNAAGTVFEQLTGTGIFDAFDSAIAKPIGMQDYRTMDGSYYYEPDKSVHPAYSFRISTRDLARLGLLLSRAGRWESKQIVPREWVAESTRSHSEIDLGDEYGSGFGYMWWVEGTRGFAARGYGGHAMVVYPERDLVMVIRCDTYHERFVSNRAIARLFEMVAAAGGAEASDNPRLVPLPPSRTESLATIEMSAEERIRYIGEIEFESGRTVRIASVAGALTIDYGLGVYRIFPESDTRFRMEDTQDPVLFELDPDGRVRSAFSEQLAYLEAGSAVQRGSPDTAVDWVRKAAEAFPESPTAHFNLARALSGTGRPAEARDHLRMALSLDPGYDDAERLLIRLQIRRYAWLIGALAIVAAWLLVRRMRRWRRHPLSSTAR